MADLLKRLFRWRPAVLSSLDAYAKWASRYPPHAHNTLMEVEEAAMRALMPDLTGKVVLDLASGTGRYGHIALGMGAQRVIALDNSPHMLRANALSWRGLASCEAIPIKSESVDVVICGLALGHLPALQPAISEIGRVLRSDGCALISDVHPDLFKGGAQRTFQGEDGKHYAVEHYPHRIRDYVASAEAAGMRLEDQRQPGLHGESRGRPIVIALHFRRD
ncbi:MAG: biotin synthase [Phototrophicales bacterium]|nr:MAG: biotin synthase [Phototrophicales bacterium]